MSLLRIIIFTGSIAQSARHRYLIYSEADFEVFFALQERHVAPMGVKFGTEATCQISSPSVQRLGYRTPKAEIFTEINALQGRTPCAIFIKFAEFVPRFRMR